MSVIRSVQPAAVALVAALLLMQTASAAQAEDVVALAKPAIMATSATTSAMLSVARAGDRLVAAGERGVILLSDDNGRTWRQAPSPVRASITTLRFIDAKNGWAAGHLGVILSTRDGGATWTRQMDGIKLVQLFKQAAEAVKDPEQARAAHSYAKMLADDGPDKPWLGMHFTDAKTGIVVGAYNLAMSTKDGGATWQPLSYRLPNPKALHLYAVSGQERSIAISGEQGLLLRSDDAGQTFSTVPSPYKGSWFGVMPRGAGEWLVYGLRGNVFQSADKGQNWNALPTGLNVSITNALSTKSGRLIVVSQTGDVLTGDPSSSSLNRSKATIGGAVADLTEAADGALVAATLRGPIKLELPEATR